MMKILIWQIIMLISMSLLNLIVNIFPSQNKFIHPMILSLILLILLIFSSISIEMFYNMNWISYLMYLIIIGGLMIIFLYFTSFINNMKMSMKWNFMKMIPLKFMLMILFLILLFYKLNINFCWYSYNNELNKLFNLTNLKFYSMYMYMYNKTYSTIFCMIYLLIMLMLIVKICINKKMSLRKIN